MARNWKIGTRVVFTTPSGSTGSGKIVAIRSTGRGIWYEIQAVGRVDNVCVRASGLEG